MQLIKNLEYIADVLNTPVNLENINDILQALEKNRSCLGLSSKAAADAEELYQTDKKNPLYCKLRVWAETADKNLHYSITSLQSILNSLKDEKNRR